MKKGKRFLLVGADSFNNNTFGNNQESFDNIEDLMKYAKYMNYRTDYIGVFDKKEGLEFEVEELLK